MLCSRESSVNLPTLSELQKVSHINSKSLVPQTVGAVRKGRKSPQIFGNSKVRVCRINLQPKTLFGFTTLIYRLTPSATVKYYTSLTVGRLPPFSFPRLGHSGRVALYLTRLVFRLRLTNNPLRLRIIGVVTGPSGFERLKSIGLNVPPL